MPICCCFVEVAKANKANKGERKQDAAKSVAGIKHKPIGNFISTQVGSPRISVFVSNSEERTQCPLQKRHSVQFKGDTVIMPSFCFMVRYTAAVVSLDVVIPIKKIRLSSDLLSFMMAIRGYCYGGIFISMRDPGRPMIWFQLISLIPYLIMIIETALDIYASVYKYILLI